MNLPELPEPYGYCPFVGEVYSGDQLDDEVREVATKLFTVEHLRAYAEEAVKQEREAIAKSLWVPEDHLYCTVVGAALNQTLRDVAAAIRSRTAVPAKE